MTADSQADLMAQFALEARLPGFWQVYRARESMTWKGGLTIPAGSYYAAHWRLDQPPVVAATLEELERAVIARMPDMPPDPPRREHRSVMRELLAPDDEGLEVSEGRFFLPGPPP